MFNAEDFVSENLEQRHQKVDVQHTDRCGSYSSISRDPYTGKLKRITFYCKQFRKCSRCAERRIKEFEISLDSIKKAIPDAQLSVVDDAEWTKAQRVLDGKDSFVRFPLDDGRCVVVHKASQKMERRAEQTHQFSELSSEALAKRLYATPKRKKISGSLGDFGINKEEKDREGTVEVKVREIHINTVSTEDVEKIEKQCKRIPKGRFSSKSALQNAIITSENQFMHWASKMGYICTIDHVRTRYVKLSEVNWT